MPYIYASMSAGDEHAKPHEWQITHSRDGRTFGIHTSVVYLSFDRETAESMIRHLEMGLAEMPVRIAFYRRPTAWSPRSCARRQTPVTPPEAIKNEPGEGKPQ